MNDEVSPNFIKEFIKELFLELSISLPEGENSKKIIDALENRITARLFLEMITMLTPEQAQKINVDIDSQTPDAEKLVMQLSKEIPYFPARIAQVLATIRVELIEDLKELQNSPSQE